MKKIIAFSIVLAVFLFNKAALLAQPSSLLQHAIALTPYVESTGAPNSWRFKNDESVAEYLPRLADAVGLPSSSGYDDIADQLEMNPYLAGQVANPRIIVPSNWQNTSDRESKSTGRGYYSPGSSSGGLSVTNLADGLAKFLVARTKQELSITFFEKFQEEVSKDPLRTVFPATSGTLGMIGKDIYQFNTYMEGMRESFEKDMRSLPTNLNLYIRTNTGFKQPFRQVLAEDVLDLSQQLIDGVSPDSIIMYLGAQSSIQDVSRRIGMTEAQQTQMADLASGLQVVQLISSSLRSPDTSRIWYSQRELDKALRNPVTLQLYLGLLWNQGQQIVLGGKKFTDALGDLNKIDDIRQSLREFCSYGQEIDQQLMYIPNANQKEAEQSNYERFYQFSSSFLKLLETGTRFKVQISGLAAQSTAADTTFLRTFQSLNELQYDARQRHYAAAVNDMIFVLDNLLKSDFSYRAQFFKYGHFIANIAEADNSDQVAAAIEAVALPAGSARLKKESAWSLSLNAYTGMAGGSERLERSGTEGFASLSAPIGIGLNKGFGGKQSLSLYVPILDVGALAAFRFNDPTAGDLPELKWGNLFSPGAYVVWGFRKNWPVALGAGAQRGPNLRKIDNVNLPDIKTDSGWRIGAFLSVDIPVFNLWSGN